MWLAFLCYVIVEVYSMEVHFLKEDIKIFQKLTVYSVFLFLAILIKNRLFYICVKTFMYKIFVQLVLFIMAKKIKGKLVKKSIVNL